MIKILVIDIVPALRKHMIEVLRNAMANLSELHFFEAADQDRALQLVAENSPELIVLDIAISGMSDIVQTVWSQIPEAKILVWTLCRRQAQLQQLTQAMPSLTCFGYVLKTETDEKLRYAIESVFVHHNTYIDPTIRAAMAKQCLRDFSLTDAEQETLNDLVVGLTDKAIGIRRGLTVRGVQNRLSSLSTKLLARQHERLQRDYGTSILNPRTRILFEAQRRGLIDVADFDGLDEELRGWLERDTFDANPGASHVLQCVPTNRPITR